MVQISPRQLTDYLTAECPARAAFVFHAVVIAAVIHVAAADVVAVIVVVQFVVVVAAAALFAVAAAEPAVVLCAVGKFVTDVAVEYDAAVAVVAAVPPALLKASAREHCFAAD